ncbi:MAG: sigma-70 family RNA polymerase sigma factor, partial [Thermoguttaceae bacterium]|nr:sigma-70 family RNA polymerase sigma factor [Thermoguttaceae bacterium]
IKPPENVASNEILHMELDKVLKTLTPREREIIKLRHGFDGGYDYTLEEIGKMYAITRERVRQIEQKALKKLQMPARADRLLGFLQDQAVKEVVAEREKSR